METHLGSGAVLFNKPRSPIETVNDLDDDITNLFQVIRERKEELVELIRWTPYSREEYNRSYEQTNDELEHARRYLVRCWMARWVKTNKKNRLAPCHRLRSAAVIASSGMDNLSRQDIGSS